MEKEGFMVGDFYNWDVGQGGYFVIKTIRGDGYVI